jgi:hypothetical protein
MVKIYINTISMEERAMRITVKWERIKSMGKKRWKNSKSLI